MSHGSSPKVLVSEGQLGVGSTDTFLILQALHHNSQLICTGGLLPSGASSPLSLCCPAAAHLAPQGSGLPCPHPEDSQLLGLTTWAFLASCLGVLCVSTQTSQLRCGLGRCVELGTGVPC